MLRDTPVLLVVAVAALYIKERRSRARLERLGAASLETLLNAIDSNNPVTGAHVRRVAEYALILADAADVDKKIQRSVERVALFHDIGKIDGALSDIINESTKLTASERRAVKTHPGAGAKVLQPLSAFYPNLAEAVLSHHERWDGKGYPRRLKGSRIPLVARIVSIADVFDAVTHSRSYSAARSLTTAKSVILEGRATQFDPDLVDLFLSPPVMGRISESLHSVKGPKRSTRTRRPVKGSQEVPDITFRWRTPGAERQPADR